MWKIAKTLVIILFLAIGCANLAFFVYWVSAAEVQAIMPISPTGYTIEALALNVTILQMVLGFVGFFVAVLGFFGYNEIKRGAINAAEIEAKQTMNEQIKIFKKILEHSERNAVPEHPGSYGLGDQTEDDATPAGDE